MQLRSGLSTRRRVAGAMLVVPLLLAPTAARAQAVHATGIERDVPAASFWRLTYENDFFAATDRYYTQGIHLEVVHPRLAIRGADRLLYAPRGTTARFGVAFEDNGWTSSDLKQATIPIGDRPYAGTKQLRAFSIARDRTGAQLTTSSLTVGLIGPGAGGREIQTFIHERTGNTIPMGWTHQIRNDLILNYEVAHERRVRRPADWAQVSATGNARLGTFHSALIGGVTVQLGRLPDALNPAPSRRALFVYAKPQLQLVGYDATLQGGVFNRSSPYTIASADVARRVYRQQLGLVYRSSTRYVEVFHTYTSKSFRTGQAHRTGGIVFGVLRSDR